MISLCLFVLVAGASSDDDDISDTEVDLSSPSASECDVDSRNNPNGEYFRFTQNWKMSVFSNIIVFGHYENILFM